MADFKHSFINPKTGRGFDDLSDITREILNMENIKAGSYAQVTFTMVNHDGSTYNYTPDEVGINASSSLTGRSVQNVIQTNNVANVNVNENAASISDIKSFAARIGIIQAARTVMNYALSSYGEWTQDPLAQAQIDNLQTSISPAQSIGMGALYGGWVGAAAAGIAEGVKLGIDAHKRHLAIARNQAGSDIMIARVGGVARTSGGR